MFALLTSLLCVVNKVAVCHGRSCKVYCCVCLTGSNYYVRILSTIDRELLKPSASVALHKHSNALVDVLPPEADSSITMLQAGTFLFFVSLHSF